MPHLFGCPCGQQFAVQPETLGQNVRCPYCGPLLPIPAPASPPPPPAAPASSPPRRWWRLPFAAAVVLVLTAGAGILLYRHLSATTEDSPTPLARNETASPKKTDSSPKNDNTEKKTPDSI